MEEVTLSNGGITLVFSRKELKKLRNKLNAIAIVINHKENAITLSKSVEVINELMKLTAKPNPGGPEAAKK